jgi:peptidoglycan/xylan/chitin deacetylase (PgdA/CDA1 family)
MDRRTVLAAAAAGTLASGCSQRHPASRAAAGPSPSAQATAPASSAGRGKEPAKGLPAQVAHGPRDRPQVALTFHGQGDPGLAVALLGMAERAGARVTVMAVGSWLDAYPQMARRVLEGGHELGNHTQTHGAIDGMSPAAAYAEIERCARRLRKLTGSPGRWFRPSRRRLATQTVRAAAWKAGYARILSYDVDSLDYTDPGAAAVRATVLREARPGSVVSLHLGHAGTVAALPGVLDGLRRRGLRAVTATELLT